MNGTLKDRRAICYVDQQCLIDVLNWRFAPGGTYLTLDGVEGVPEDARVESVFYDPCRRALGVVLAHELFDLVPCGCLMPIIGTTGRIVLKKREAADVEVIRDTTGFFTSAPLMAADPEVAWAPEESSTDFFRRVMGTP
jgi:hypothetical protein